ncbi:MarR family winged helix-turn-helix transcriptional regulator [Microbacterium awajiense]
MIHVDLLSYLSLAGGALDGHVREQLRSRGFEGLRVRHGYVFQRLLVGPQSITELGRSLSVSQQAMSKTVRELANLGYVDTGTDPGDARRRVVRLTDRGRASITTAREIRSQLEARLARSVDGREVDGARAVITALLAELGLGDRIAERSAPDPDPERTDPSA